MANNTLMTSDILKMIEATSTTPREAIAILEAAAASCIFTASEDIELVKAYIKYIGKFHALFGGKLWELYTLQLET